MKKLLLVCVVIISAIALTQCSSSKKATSGTSASSKQSITYTNNIQSVVTAQCGQCHYPARGGRAKALDTYEAVKNTADDIIRRIEMQPDQRGFMPMKHPRLSDSTINMFKEWRDGGLMQ